MVKTFSLWTPNSFPQTQCAGWFWRENFHKSKELCFQNAKLHVWLQRLSRLLPVLLQCRDGGGGVRVIEGVCGTSVRGMFSGGWQVFVRGGGIFSGGGVACMSVRECHPFWEGAHVFEKSVSGSFYLNKTFVLETPPPHESSKLSQISRFFC